MHLTSILILVGSVLLVMAVICGLIVFWSRILASRPARVGVALLTLPIILFCGFGFLASFEGSDARFVAFRVGYGVAAMGLGVMLAYLGFGRVPRLAGQ